VTTRSAITSRFSGPSSMSRKKSAMHSPSAFAWRGRVKRASSVVPSSSNTTTSLPSPAAFQ